ncbi:MAG: para-nitrobenzyl esterase [Mycobacteriales bacterium]
MTINRGRTWLGVAALSAGTLLGTALPAAAGTLGSAALSGSSSQVGGEGLPAGQGSGLVVRTDAGAVRGVRAGGVDSFLGLRYAAAPVGPLRWRPPRPAPAWSGVRPASRYGNRCPATASTNGPRSETEDCLFLNVQRPAGARPGARLPVYLFIHGGGLQNGSSNQHDGSLIVTGSGVLVVTINYRLGVFGFLGHPGLTAERGESGNYGFLDQQAALRWVRRNIAAFGGDPGRVTIGGESAGGFSVCAHLSAPGSRGLFAGAMIQSGSCPSQTQAAAEAVGTTLASRVGCTDAPTAVACLRAVPTGQLLDAGASAAFVRGGTTLPLDPAVAIQTGRFARVPVVIGANRDEGRTFSQGFVGGAEAAYTGFVQSRFGTNADAVLARYPWPAGADQFTAAYLVGAVFTDSGLLAGIGGCTNRALTADFARWTPTYAYEFDHRTGPGLAPTPAGYVWGAGHAAELAYLWPSFDNGTPIAPTFDAAERRLAGDMVRYWGSFVRSGRPGAARLAAWPRYGARPPAGQPRVLSLRAGGHSVALPDAAVATEHQCGFWNSLPAA